MEWRDQLNHCVIIADDLTGACDAALQFRKRGAKTLVHLKWDADLAEPSGVHAFSTDSRTLNACESEQRVRQLAALVTKQYGSPSVIFKKIDSLMRGLPGIEIAATLDAFACDVAVITPAFPELGRRVVDGHLHVEGDTTWNAVDMLATMRNQGLYECEHVSAGEIARSLATGCRYISVDSASKDDLTLIADEAMCCGRKMLWAGSAGLASAVAELMFPTIEEPANRTADSRPVLFVIGSNHPITAVQLEMLESISPEQRTIIHLPMDNITAYEIRAMLPNVKEQFAAVVVSGGDTLSLVGRAMEIECIEIEGQILDGLPFGQICGGVLNGVAVATKSGAFGHPDALIKVMDFFTCPTN